MHDVRDVLRKFTDLCGSACKAVRGRVWPRGCRLDRLRLEQLGSPKSTFTSNQFYYSEQLGKKCSNNAMYGDSPGQKTVLTGGLHRAHCYPPEEPRSRTEGA